ncbi:MAG: hypothetical protein CVV49_19175 [Spirochaetae bacterium HGW-Spirochaetae-5]|nr:MAG: hypothetical protein CVV49_19175 [Spirochaetae bacterium HGW-Spirochaetae-5]
MKKIVITIMGIFLLLFLLNGLSFSQFEFMKELKSGHHYELYDKFPMAEKLPDYGIKDAKFEKLLFNAAVNFYEKGEIKGIKVKKIILWKDPSDWIVYSADNEPPSRRLMHAAVVIKQGQDKCMVLFEAASQLCSKPNELTNECNGWWELVWADHEEVIPDDRRISCSLVK